MSLQNILLYTYLPILLICRHMPVICIFRIGLQSVFSKIRVRHEFKPFSRQKKQTSDWLTYLVYQLEACFQHETTFKTHVLTQISEKTDFSLGLSILKKMGHISEILDNKCSVFSSLQKYYYYFIVLQYVILCISQIWKAIQYHSTFEWIGSRPISGTGSLCC